MPNLNVSFNGATLIVPGAYAADNPSAVLQPAQPTTPPLVFLGYGNGQKPLVPVTYTNANDLLLAMRGGASSGFVPFMCNPSNQVAGAQQVTYIQVGENTQSAYTASAATSGVITFTSANYGVPSNLLQLQIVAGTISGKNVTLFDGYSNQLSPVGVNLGTPLQIAYTGSATGVTYAVTTSGGAATALTTTSPNAGESLNVNLSNSAYGTVEKVAQYLNGTGFYQAQVLSNNGQLPASGLDACSGTVLAVQVSGLNQYQPVYATLTDIVYWANTFAGAFATAAIVSGITSASGKAPTNIPYTPFTGATSVPPTLSDYASGFNVALTIPGWAVCCDSTSSGVVALGTQHAATASLTQNGRWRRFFTGSALGDTVAATASAALAQNSLSTTYVYPGVYRVNTATGQNTLYAGVYAAAALAGMATGNPPAMPLTNKSLSAVGVETTLSTAQIDQLQQAGVAPIWLSPQTGVPTVVSDFTTWANDANPANVFNQQVACRFFLEYTLVNSLQPYVGTVATPQTEAVLLNAAKAALNASIYTSANQNGVISSWDSSTLKLTYTAANQTAAIQVNVTLVGQNRFITIYVPLQPLSFTITDATASQLI